MASNPTKLTFLENDQQLRDLVSDFESARVDAENFASATGSFTDADGNTFQKGAKGWAADAKGHKNTAQTKASSAETAADDASADAATAQGAADKVVGRVSEETESHGVPLSEESLLRFFLDRYADGQNGDGTYTGESAQYALPGLSDLETYLDNNAPGAYVGIVGGQAYKEEIKINEADALVTGLGRPGQKLPLVDCSDELADGDWSLATNQSNTYVQSEPEPSPLPNANTPRVFEDGSELTEKGAIADVDADPGSYYVDKSADPWSIYVHPTGSTDPSTDNKLYEWTARSGAVQNIQFGGSVVPNTIRGLRARRPLANDGAITTSPGGTIDRCFVEGGAKHHFLHGGGLIRDSVVAGQSPNFGSFNSIGVIFFHGSSTPRPQPAVVENLIGVDYNNQLMSTNAHDGFEGTTIRGGALTGSSQTGGVLAQVNDQSDVRGLYAYRARGVASNDGTTITVGESMLDTLGGNPLASNIQGGVTFENCVVLKHRLKRRTRSNPQGVTLKNCLLIGGRLFLDIDDVGGTITLEKCIVVTQGRGTVDPDYTVTGDDCVFVAGVNAETSLRSQKSLSQLQTDTSAFGNSVVCTLSQWRSLLKGEWRKGDARVNEDADVTKADGTVLSGELPDGTPITNVGPQKHWDYHRKEARSGAPAQWPTPPTTTEEAEEYTRAPGAWAWRDTPEDHKTAVSLGDRLAAYWKMDGASGENEPDAIQGQTLEQTGGIGAGSAADFPYRSLDGSDDLFELPRANYSSDLVEPRRVWIAFPIRVFDLSTSNNRLWDYSRDDGTFLATEGASSLKFSLMTNRKVQNVSISASTNSFLIAQLWYDSESARHGFRLGGTETLVNSVWADNVKEDNDPFRFLGVKQQIDVGPTMIANAVPSQSDRDWLQNGGAFRSLTEIQNRTVTLRDIY